MSSPVTFVVSVDDQRRQDGRTWAVMYLGVITVSAVLGLIALQSTPRFFSLPLTMLLISSVLVVVKPVAGPYVIAFFAVMSDGVINPWYPFTFGLSNQASVLFVTNSLTISPLELLLILTAVGWLLRLLIDRSSPRPGAGRAVAAHGGLHRVHLLRHRRRPRHRWEPVCRHLGVPALPAAAGPVRARDEPVHDPPSLRVAGRGRAALTRGALRPGAAGTLASCRPRSAPPLESLVAHPAAVQLSIVLFVAIASWTIKGAPRWLRWLSLVASVPVGWAWLVSQRRAAVIAFAFSIIVLGVLLTEAEPAAPPQGRAGVRPRLRGLHRRLLELRGHGRLSRLRPSRR